MEATNGKAAEALGLTRKRSEARINAGVGQGLHLRRRGRTLRSRCRWGVFIGGRMSVSGSRDIYAMVEMLSVAMGVPH